jgi:alkanesulfonate monooxygenase SsuD/methylene tetrahydromethanopterin reductase-like flavin-dependent oxidoreductase (luciferase family)
VSTSTKPEFHLFLPQMRMRFDDLVERARAAEAAGFTGIALMDHLAPPMAEQHDMFDAMVTATWLGAHTSTLTVGHLVLCDSFRHPAVLAKQAVSIDHATNGRFEVGIGWGSVPDEFTRFGIGTTENKARVARLEETLRVTRALWSGNPVDFDGVHHQLVAAQQNPVPTSKIPVVIGGTGPRTLRLVAQYADWWNCPTYGLERFEELRSQAGDARVSIQQQLAFVPSEDERADVTALTRRRFGDGPLVAGSPELIDYHGRLVEQGVERFYLWFTDFAMPDTLAQYGAEVIDAF